MRIILAVSGGIDSMYLANRASDIFPEASFAIAHCNFRLRGTESDGDESFVKEWAGRHGIPVHIKRFDTADYAAEHGISIEMAARELRYGWFEELRVSEGYDSIALAHNANDNAETLILNLLRGTGSRGIRGMAASTENFLVRPLLGITREEIHEWMEEHSCEWREDSSNADSVYKRNLVRNEIFPLFRRINPSAVETLNADMKRFALVDDVARTYFELRKESLFNEDGSISVAALMADPHWEYLLWRCVEDSGINAEEFASLCACMDSGRQYAGKRFGPVLGAADRLVSGYCDTTESKKLKTEIFPIAELDSIRQPVGVLVIDAEAIKLPLKIRNWQRGDWMRPLGLGGRKKISDILTESGYSIDQKKSARVIELDGSHVGALLCERIDDSLKITSKTEKVLRISFE